MSRYADLIILLVSVFGGIGIGVIVGGWWGMVFGIVWMANGIIAAYRLRAP